MREQHLDFLAITARLRERWRFGEGPSDIACGLMDVAFDPSRWHFGATLRFERAGTTLRHGAEILERVIGADMTRRCQRLARRACIDVLHLVVDEVLARERAVFALRFVDDRHMRRDP